MEEQRVKKTVIVYITLGSMTHEGRLCLGELGKNEQRGNRVASLKLLQKAAPNHHVTVYLRNRPPVSTRISDVTIDPDGDFDGCEPSIRYDLALAGVSLVEAQHLRNNSCF